MAATLCDRIVVSTPYMSELLAGAGVPREKFRTVPLGVRPNRTPQAREQIRRQLGWADQDFVMLAVARLVEHKGLEALIQAFQGIRHPEKRLVIVGDGPQRERLTQAAAAVDPERITLLGHVDEIAPFYAAADLFTLPSEQEGFGLVFVEAAFHGLPSVAAGVWGVPYVIEHGKTGLLVPPRDPIALGEAISQLTANRSLLRQMGEAARMRAETEFTDECMTSGYERILFND
jgi:glycosyltransferase involved in cell wall biosynthesis